MFALFPPTCLHNNIALTTNKAIVRAKPMFISDLSYLEDVPETPSIVGGKKSLVDVDVATKIRVNPKVKIKPKITIINQVGISTAVAVSIGGNAVASAEVIQVVD